MNRETLDEIIDFVAKPTVTEASAPHPDGGLVFVTMPRFDDLERLHTLAVEQIGAQVAQLKAMQDIYSHNPESVWAIYRSRSASKADAVLAGFYAFLHLNEAGLEALNARTLRPRYPDLALLAPAGERPAAVYIWAVVAKKLTNLTIPLIGKAMGVKRYGGLPFYATAGTMGGLNRLRSYGFAGASDDDDSLGDLFQFYMPGEADRATYAA